MEDRPQPLPEAEPKGEPSDELSRVSLRAPEKVLEGELTLSAARASPDAKLIHVTEAAKRGDALERLYELRQEVRDKAANHTATPIGNIIAGVASRQPGLAGYYEQADPPSGQSSTDNRGVHHSGSMYGQAIRGGFIAALLVLLVMVVFFLLTP